MKISIIQLWSATHEHYAVAVDYYGLQYAYVEAEASWLPVQENSDISRPVTVFDPGVVFINIDETVAKLRKKAINKKKVMWDERIFETVA
nr:MAG TPA: hypothetical protein [Caudoviricetes sp.]